MSPSNSTGKIENETPPIKVPQEPLTLIALNTNSLIFEAIMKARGNIRIFLNSLL